MRLSTTKLAAASWRKGRFGVPFLFDELIGVR